MILVTGATGFVGRHIIQRLMADGQPLRVLVPQDRLRRITWQADDPAAPEVIVGTLMDEEALFQAMSGVHVILHLENAMWWGRARDFERVEMVGTRNLVTAARSARVGRIITLSHLGASPSSAFILLRYKGQYEALVRNSGLAYTILRPGILYGEDDAFINHIGMILSLNPFFYLQPGFGETILHPLYIYDLVEVMARCLNQLNTVDEILDIGGPEYITLADLLQTVMRVTGMYRATVNMPPYLIRFLTRIYGIIWRRTLITGQWLDYLAANRAAPLGNLYNTFGFQPKRFEDTLLTYLPQKRFFFAAIRHAFRRKPRSL